VGRKRGEKKISRRAVVFLVCSAVATEGYVLKLIYTCFENCKVGQY
jgi:hypothetical protein